MPKIPALVLAALIKVRTWRHEKTFGENLPNRIVNMHLIGFLLPAIKLEWKLAPKPPRCYVSPQNQVGVFCKLGAMLFE